MGFQRHSPNELRDFVSDSEKPPIALIGLSDHQSKAIFKVQYLQATLAMPFYECYTLVSRENAWDYITSGA